MSYTFVSGKIPGVMGSCKRNAKMHSITWMGVGGIASMLFQPKDAEDLATFLRSTSISARAIGAGSKIIARDGVIDGAVVKLGREFSYMECEGSTITAGCAASLKDLSAFARDNAISGFEFCVGIPGTVGGAIATNACAYGQGIASVLHSLRAINEYGEVCTLNKDDIQYTHCNNGLENRWIFVEATFIGQKADFQEIKNTMSELAMLRHSFQPIYGGKAIGYIFKNPRDSEMEARALIEKAGCKGLRRGHAVISEKHCNFIENTGRATASDIEDLCHEVKDKVKEKLQVDLELSIEFWGSRST